MYQTSIQSAAYFIIGSAKLEVQSSYGSTSYTNFGACRGVKFAEGGALEEAETDSLTPITYMRNQTVIVEGEMLEANLKNLSIFRGGVDSYSTTANKVFTSGGLSSAAPLAIKLTHTASSSGQYLELQVFAASLAEPLKVNYVSDHDTDIGSVTFKMKGYCQSSRTAGAQLYQLTDTRST